MNGEAAQAHAHVDSVTSQDIIHLSPVKIISIAFDLPTALMSLCVPPIPGMTPSCISGCIVADNT